MTDVRAKHVTHALGAGGSHRGDDDGQLGVLGTQLANKRCGRDRLSHGHSVNPQPLPPRSLLLRGERYEAESLGPASCVGWRTDRTPQQAQNDQRQDQREKDVVGGSVQIGLVMGGPSAATAVLPLAALSVGRQGLPHCTKLSPGTVSQREPLHCPLSEFYDPFVFH